jgi:hypothetical protein
VRCSSFSSRQADDVVVVAERLAGQHPLVEVKTSSCRALPIRVCCK